MSVIIIIGGGHARDAITQLENASIGMSQAQRDAAEAMLSQFASCAKDMADGNDGTAYPFPAP